MKHVLAIRHVHFEDLGTLEPLLQELGYHITYADAVQDELSAVDAVAPDLLVLLGGPIGAFDEEQHPFLLAELDLLRRRVASGKPLLGICLGAQLMARVLGAKVYPMGVQEIGFSSLALTDAGRQSPLAALATVPVLHWHGDQFDIPPGALRLAGTSIGPNQAFSMGPKLLGLQFHLEADARRLDSWLVGHAGELAQAGIDPRTLREQARQHGAQLAGAARAVMTSWLASID
ncbi:glutamine amidotransferase [Janthinobacterium agaricidamnosum]|uniref:Glutamine amidotransferase class-I family protein n=1 Tax=Janthinobacterium agaricidamnosum NBRC 102515 = DSM 9628 TaxID=1349767 RepID=W0V7C6_9BURK|nr:glutamine amidotransferase [Janthinobacterium agaricidamnosum]CDG83172.1 glutamine amidotransferase class-I family protein [Janthinobacterium agaricidamnosum NBRC 102515 = DSM 9628]